MKYLWLALRSEFYKSRRTMALATTIWLPILIATLFFLIFFLKSKDFAQMGMNPWLLFAQNLFGLYALLILPMYVIVVAFSTNQIEHTANAWKNVFTLPFPKLSVYLAKWLYAFLLIALFSALVCGLFFLTGNLLAVLKPEIGFQDYASYALIGTYFFKFFIGVLGVFSIQFLMSFHWRDFIRPVGVGLSLNIAGAILARWKYAYLIPFSETVRLNEQFHDNNTNLWGRELLVSVLATLILFGVGYVVVLKRSTR